MLNPLAKQSEAIHMATKDLYSSIFGETHVEPIHGTGFYGLIADEVRKSLCRELSVSELNQLPREEYSNAQEAVRLRYYQLIERESDYGKNYLYHKAFFKAFLEKAEYEKEFGIPLRYYLRDNYAPNSTSKPKQLDTWEDYEYLSEKIREALSDSPTEHTPYQRQYLANALTWFTEKAAELQPREFDSPAISVANNSLAVPAMPAPPVPRPPIQVDGLCLNSFTPADLTELLLSLKAIPKELPHRWTKKPAGRGGAPSRIAAALTVLSQEPSNLFSPDKSLWPEAIQNTYGVTLSEKIMEYKYSHKNIITSGTEAFDTATKETQAWIKRWKSK